MKQFKFFVLTGATSGLGFEAATMLAQASPENIMIVGVRTFANTHVLRAALPERQLRLFDLDTSSLRSVASFAAQVVQTLDDNKISGLALNAGVQIVSGDQFSADGYERTFATNVLGHIALFQQLQAKLAHSAVIVSTASGTHDKDHKLARPYKFYGGYFPSAAAVAAGKVSDATDAAQLGRDRYATSKLCNILFTYAQARKFGSNSLRFIALDPGLMPGTELARDQPAALRFAWKNILPTAALLIDGASTANRSGSLLADLLSGKCFPNKTGLHVEFTGGEIASSLISYDEKLQDELMTWSDEAISAHLS